MIKLLIGGSPCTHWSIAQTKNRETKPEGIGWELFKNYLIAKEMFKPDLFLYENNQSAAPAIKEQICKELGQDLMYINSAIVSAQQRKRFYVFNWKVEQPQDRGILLKDILESFECIAEREKTYAQQHIQGNIVFKPICVNSKSGRSGVDNLQPSITNRIYSINGKSTALLSGNFSTKIAVPIYHYPFDGKPVYTVKDGYITYKDKQYPINLEDGDYIIRKLTVKECERLQTLPDEYTSALLNGKPISDTQRYKCLGNGWTAEVITHILNGALAKVPRDEKIVVLSMYDGIATGRYCLDKMGFTNVDYYAYEIDKYAKAIALSNYPDITQMGDAFDIRR